MMADSESVPESLREIEKVVEESHRNQQAAIGLSSKSLQEDAAIAKAYNVANASV